MHLVSPQPRGFPRSKLRPKSYLCCPERKSLPLCLRGWVGCVGHALPESPGSAASAPDRPEAPGQAEPPARGLPASLLLWGRTRRLRSPALQAPGQHLAWSTIVGEGQEPGADETDNNEGMEGRKGSGGVRRKRGAEGSGECAQRRGRESGGFWTELGLNAVHPAPSGSQ